MERSEKDTHTSAFHAHCFPAIDGRCETPDAPSDCFRPLFQASSPGSESTDTPRPEDSRAVADETDPLAAALKCSFERGVAAGHQDACNLARNALKPKLERFFQKIGAFSDNFNRLTGDYPAHIVALSQSIAGKIIGHPVEPASAEMRCVRNALDALLRRLHQLDLQLNGDDLKQLTDLMNEWQVVMNASGAVQISASDAVQSGNPLPADPAASFEDLLERFIRELKAMSAAAPLGGDASTL